MVGIMQKEEEKNLVIQMITPLFSHNCDVAKYMKGEVENSERLSGSQLLTQCYIAKKSCRYSL